MNPTGKQAYSSTYVCSTCSHAGVYSVECPKCGNQHTMKRRQLELVGSFHEPANPIPNLPPSIVPALGDEEVLPIRARSTPLDRVKIGLPTFDRALDGGLVKSSATLMGGEPGAGKSTLALRMAGAIPFSLYIATEENREQVEDRATRTGHAIGCPLLCTQRFDRIAKALLDAGERRRGPDKVELVIIDSGNKINGWSVEVADDLQRLCKASRVALLVVAQVVKDGSIAGPKELQHLFDTVLLIEKTENQTRILLVDKSRYAPSPCRYPLLLSGKGWEEVQEPPSAEGTGRDDTPSNGERTSPLGT